MASTYLTRTPSSAGNRRTWTWSAWIKKATIAVSPAVTLFGAKDGGYPEILYFASDDTLVWQHDISGSDYLLTISNKVFRDTNAWYHIVLTKDTTQSTEANRVKIYINGEQQTLTESQLGFPGQNYEGAVNNNVTHTIGNWEGNSYYFDGSMSHVHFIDGTAYDASAFGETDATTGEWKIKTDVSVTYGTNGFFILKDGNSVTDQSGNSNNFTVGGGTLTKTEDSPSNVFATMNPLDNFYPSATFSNGNNTVVTNSTAICPITGTLGMTSGKYYWEVKPTATSGSDSWYTIGITGRQTTELNQELGNYAYQYGYMGEDGTVRNNSSNIATLSTYTAGDIIGIALDLDNNLIYFYKNGAVQNSGTGLSVSSSASTDLGAYFPAVADWSSTATFTFQTNFGNGYFGTTAVSSAGTNASGIGIFEYDVPTGYTALSTKGLNL